jgi:hypothetical protein
MTLPRTLILVSCLAVAAGAGLAQNEVSQSTPASPSQTPAAEKKAAEPAPTANPYAIGPVQFSGLVDGYYSLNFNHPASGNNQLRNFDLKANQFSLNMAKVTMEHTADPVGFRLDLGFGRAFDLIHAGEKSPDVFRYIEQAYVSLKPPKGKGFQVDFGKFVTSAGAEVIESNSNWNYSRSLLFAWAIPYYHFGLRTTMPVGKYFTGGVQLVNGWNNVEDNNSGKTWGFTGTFANPKISWSNNYYVGPEKAGTNKGYRQVYDTTLLLTPNPKANFYLNYDYGRDKNVGRGANSWYGIAGAARFQLNGVWAFAPRLEWFKDKDGFSTGTAQSLKEVTLTVEAKLNDYAVTRFEYRRDWSDQPFFDRGGSAGVHKNQDTLLIGIVAFFGPKK